MKNILKKIGVIGLTIAVLAPFIELPKVKAANTGCTDQTVMQYYFLDVANGGSKKDWTTYTETYSTFTQFYFTFPEDVINDPTRKINVTNATAVYMNTNDQLTKFAKNVETIVNKKGQDSYEVKNNGVIANSETSQNKTYTAVLHGKWSKSETREDITLNRLAGWINPDDTEGSANTFRSNTIQRKIGKVSSSDDVKVTISGMGYDGELVKAVEGYDQGYDLKEFFQDLANKENDSLYYTDSDGTTWLALNINRTISSSKLADITFGYKCEGDNCEIDGVKKNSGYWTWKDYTKLDSQTKDATTGSYSATDEPKILSDEQIYWPVILNIEYEVCPTSSNPEGENWTLKYDLNTDDDTATGKPADQTEKVGADIKVDAKKPKRDGYTFQSWNTEKDGSGTKYNPDDTFKSDGTTETKYLYAQWGKGGTTDNEKTGVASYVIGFISVGLVATGIYLVAKKKNLFKQI